MIRGPRVRFSRMGPVPQTGTVLPILGDNPNRTLVDIRVEGVGSVRLFEQDRESSGTAGFLLEATAGASVPLVLLGPQNAIYAGAASGAAVFVSVAEVSKEDIG